MLNCNLFLDFFVGGAVASWLGRLTPERAVRVRALAGDIVLCFWAKHRKWYYDQKIIFIFSSDFESVFI